MIRTQISLTEAQMADLQAEAKRRRVSIASIVRSAVQERSSRIAMDDARRRAAGAAGRFGSGKRDAGTKHDEYL
jgi:hypothetical protein